MVLSGQHGITASQAWSILSRHARDEIEPLRLQELCRDNDRVSSLVCVYTTESETSSMTTTHQPQEQEPRILIADLSRQRITLETLNHLLKLANARQLRKFITQLAWGQNNPYHPVLPAKARSKGKKHQEHPHQRINLASNMSRTSSVENSPRNRKTTRFLEMEPPSPSSPRDGRDGTTTTKTSNDNSNNTPGFLSPTFSKAATTSKTASSVPDRQANDYNNNGDSQHTSTSTTATGTTPEQYYKIIPSMHLALRVPAGKGYEMLLPHDGTNVLVDIHREWDRLERLSDCIRRGQLQGVSGNMIRDVVVIGRGVPVAALKFVYTALLKDERAVLASRFGLVEAASTRIRRNLVGAASGVPAGHVTAARGIRFLTSVDPVSAAEVVSDLDAGSTLVVSIALNGNEETGLATKTLKTWLLQALGSNRRADHILAKHMILVTGNDRIASVINKPESVHMIPEHSRCEAFTTFSPAALLPLSIVFGWPIVKEFIAGAHDMDTHFVSTNPRHNLPVLLALCDVWNDTFFGSSARIVTPFTKAFAAFPAFVGALEAQTCSRSPDRNLFVPGERSCASSVIDGGLDSAFDRSSYQANHIMNSELLMTLDSQISFNTSRNVGSNGLEDVFASQDALMCSLFAHADELAFGSNRSHNDSSLHPSQPNSNPFGQDSDVSEGNRPSLLLFTGKVDAFACGQLIALAEHRAIVKAHLWGLDPFVRDSGSALRMQRTDQLKDDLQTFFLGTMTTDEEEDAEFEGRLNLSTRTILRHYSTFARDQKLRSVNGI